MSASVATTTALRAPAAAPATAPRPGDPACVAFTGGADGFRHAGTRSLAVDLAPLLAAILGSTVTTAVPLAA